MKRIFPYTVLLASLALAGCAAYYSVFGLSKLFSAQAVAVIVMASILEASKLITASYLHRYWKRISILMRVYLTSALVVLMLITSIGIYGFLVSAYQETAYKLQNVEQEVAVLDLKRNRFQEQLTSIQSEKNTLNTNISELTSGLANNVIQYRDREGNLITTTSSATRKALETQLNQSVERRDRLSDKEIALTDSVSNIDTHILSLQTESDVAAEIGPLKYVASITGQDTDRVVNWFILLFIFVFDPLAVILLVSANKALGKHDDPDQVPVINEPEPTEPESGLDLDKISEKMDSVLEEDFLDESGSTDPADIKKIYQEFLNDKETTSTPETNITESSIENKPKHKTFPKVIS